MVYSNLLETRIMLYDDHRLDCWASVASGNVLFENPYELNVPCDGGGLDRRALRRSSPPVIVMGIYQ